MFRKRRTQHRTTASQTSFLEQAHMHPQHEKVCLDNILNDVGVILATEWKHNVGNTMVMIMNKCMLISIPKLIEDT